MGHLMPPSPWFPWLSALELTDGVHCSENSCPFGQLVRTGLVDGPRAMEYTRRTMVQGDLTDTKGECDGFSFKAGRGRR